MSISKNQDLDRVMSFREWHQRVGVSDKTGRRLLARNKGPTITRLSEGRIGIRERDHIEWLDANRISPAAAA